MKQLKELLVIPQNGSAKGVNIDPDDLHQGDIAIDWSLADVIREVTVMPIDTNDPRVLEARINFLRRHGFPIGSRKNVAKTERGKRYLESFSNQEERVIEISEDDLKRKIWEHCEEKAKAGNELFIWDSSSIWMIRNMMYYFANDPRCDWPLDKGLLISGNIGVGKTWLFEIFRDISRKYLKPSGKNFKMCTCRDVYQAYSEDENTAIEKYTDRNWCFDDLGNEPLERKDYGNSVLPMESILTHRYGKFKAYHYLTHLSTNLSVEEIRERYGERMFDRLMQMTHVVSWTGDSKRR